MIPRAGDGQVAFSFHIRCVGVCVFSLLKNVDRDISCTLFWAIWALFLTYQALTPYVESTTR